MWLSEHCARCKEFFGDEFKDANIWIDQYFKVIGGWHRLILHHQLGLDLVLRHFGVSGYEPLKLHIEDDFEGIVFETPVQVWESWAKSAIPSGEIKNEILHLLHLHYGTDFGLANKWDVRHQEFFTKSNDPNPLNF